MSAKRLPAATLARMAISPSFLFGINFYLVISREWFLVLCLNSGDILLRFRPVNLQIQATRLQFDDGSAWRRPAPLLLGIPRPIRLRRLILQTKSARVTKM